MRVVIFSDIHANLEALDAIFADTAAVAPDRYVCLGDVVGYYSDPEECVHRIREREVLCVQGNHDAVASGFEEPIDFNAVAMRAIRWTHDELSVDSREWLHLLPRRIEIAPGIIGVHGSLRDRDEYLLSRFAVRTNLELLKKEGATAAFFGHTHQRAAYAEANSGVAGLSISSVELSADRCFLINPGGAGQPRDHIVGAPYVLLDGITAHFRVALYDLEQTAQKVERLPYGTLLAERLRRGV